MVEAVGKVVETVGKAVGKVAGKVVGNAQVADMWTHHADVCLNPNLQR